MELTPTTKVAEALALAQRSAQSAGNPEVTPTHLALVLAEQPETSTPALLEAAGTTAAQVATAARSALSRMPVGSGPSTTTPTLSQGALALLQHASTLMAATGDTHLATDLLVLALVETGALPGVPGSRLASTSCAPVAP